ncbi:MAG TPA: ornithine cyclodeaminase family protein [Actinomycetota bacterium]|nr:ornithine cyclodeaminase family protein [Actinomycetota bacterium]
MALTWIGASELRDLLPVRAAVDALEQAFAAGRLPEAPLRAHHRLPQGELLLMPSWGEAGVGVKLVTLAPGNPDRGLPFLHAVYVLFDPGTLEPLAALDGAALTALRTSAVSALATRHLANPDASRLVLFGAGTQAAVHLEAMVVERPVERVTVVSRTRARAEALAERARARGLKAEVGGPEAVGDADLVCTCTTSSEPVFDGRLVPPGAHVNAVGAYRPDMREVDEALVRRARVVVETREAALAEAGDLLVPLRAGVIGEDHVVADLAEVVRGKAVRTAPDDVTLFKSVGVAFEDLVVAGAAYERLRGG